MQNYLKLLQPLVHCAAQTYRELEPEMARVQTELHALFTRLLGKGYSTRSYGPWTNLAVFRLNGKEEGAPSQP